MDLFETPEVLPSEVLAILQKYQAEDNTYEMCENLMADLETVGYTCEYSLDAVPYDLRKIIPMKIDSYNIKQYENERVVSNIILLEKIDPKKKFVLAYVETLQANCLIPVKEIVNLEN